MRNLSEKEMHAVSGGVRPRNVTDLAGMTVRPDRSQGTGVFQPAPVIGGGPLGGGGSSIPGGHGNGGLTAHQVAGIARIKNELGVDLTEYALMSPTLAQQIATATATYNFHFALDPKGSWLDRTDQVSGTVHIKSDYQNDPLTFVQQISHELGHVEHKVPVNAKQTTAEVFINQYLQNEGYSTLANERVRWEIKSKTGQDINVAGTASNTAVYDAEYARWANGQQTYSQAAQNIGAHYSQHEITQNMTYHDYYLSEYRRLGGRQ